MTKDVTIYYNPGCNTCRTTLGLLRDTGIEPEVVEYLEDGPTADELRELLGKLGIGPRELVRTSEPAYTEQQLQDASDDELIEAMARTPLLIQRPIVVSGGRAVIGRPPEKVLELLED